MLSSSDKSYMSCEKYTQIFSDYLNGYLIRPGKEPFKLDFELDGNPDEKYRLLAVGETGIFYQWKNEPDNPAQYKTISDSLDTDNAYKGAYALKLSSAKPERYIKRAMKKILWTPKLAYINMNPTPEIWDVGLYYKTKNLKIESGGYLRMRVDIRYENEAVSREFNLLEADLSYKLDIPEGTSEWTKLSERITIGKNVASVSVFIEGVCYSGDVFVERPFIVSPEIPDKNVLPDFSMPAGRDYFEWTGQYLSRKEWPEFEVKLNGTLIFRDEIFERCHVGSEWSIDLPGELLSGKNTLEIKLISDYHDPLPYNFFELGVISSPAGRFALIATSKTARAGGKAHALIRTAEDNVRIKAEYRGTLCGKGEFYFEKKGLHGISFDACEPSENSFVSLTDGKKTAIATVSRIVLRDDDSVVTGTGDMIYINQNMKDAEEYLAWYLSAGIGNLFTIRPTYRWSGSRVLNPEVFETVSRILNEWGISYSHMLDGRELPGLNANPTEDDLKGEHFLGRQIHERDGACFYWRRYSCERTQTAMQYRDLFFEAEREDFAHFNLNEKMSKYVFPNIGNKSSKKALSTAPTFDGDAKENDLCYVYKNPSLIKDMKVAYDESIRCIKTNRADIKRHTGPSALFKYMYDGGYTWLGAETMYGTMEPLLAFARGAALDRGKSSIGVHHALQWSSSPEDAPEHIRRYRLALYVSYMQGATEINTEEGLWHLEEYYTRFHRFSNACIEHTRQQQDFYSYVSTHTRRGSFYTPMGLIHGRYDGWHGFGRNSTWGWLGVSDSDAERSWDLLSAFYPEQNLGDALYYHGFPADKPLGFHSSTPIGCVDTVPVEQHQDTYKNYRALAFMGYNKAEDEDLEKLESFVRSGGKLLLTRAHLTSTTLYDDIHAGKLEYFDTPLSFTDGAPRFRRISYNNESLLVCTNAKAPDEVLIKAEDGSPLVIRYTLGKGEVTLFNVSAYPAHPAIRSLYERELVRHANYAWESEPVRVICGDGMESAIYKRGDERDVYFLAVDWYRKSELSRRAKLIIGRHEHEIKLPFGVMIKASVASEYAAYPHSEDAEVISIKDGVALIQGTGKVMFTFINADTERCELIDFTDSSVKHIKI